MRRLRRQLPRLVLGAFALLALAALWVVAPGAVPRTASRAAASDKPPTLLDPAAWGSDHVDEFLPDYVDGGECLFCHRKDVGGDWQRNRHALTIRDAHADLPAMQALAAHDGAGKLLEEVELVLGSDRAGRFLKRGTGYGRLDMLTAVAQAGRGRRFRLHHTDDIEWDTTRFAERCAGCHTTGVDPEEQRFSSISLDCFACHGDGPLEHSNDASLMPLAEAREDPPRVVISICASCHIRFGKSRATGLPFPTNFVAGDNLFRDFEVDFSLADDESINPGDRHVLDNVRDVVLYGKEEMTCLSCHQVHGGSSAAHRDLPDQRYCLHCHEADQPKSVHKLYEVHSELCEY